jgi:P pilus assembly chaperone PapD
MKIPRIIWMLFILILITGNTGNLFAQVIISPYVAFTNQNSKSTTVFVSNNSLETQEMQVSIRFGYPVSDSKGKTIMEYPDSTNPGAFDLTKYVKVFPKKFFLEPGEQQSVRITVKAPVDLPAGVYWTRIVTTSSVKNSNTVVSNNQFAKVKLVLSQVTTLIFKNKRYENSLSINEFTESNDRNNLDLMTKYEVRGDSPFFALSNITVYDLKNTAVRKKQESFSLYNAMNRKTSLDISGLASGDYCAEIQVKANLKADIPLSDKPMKTPITKRIYFTIE